MRNMLLKNGEPYIETTGYWMLRRITPQIAQLRCSECNGVSFKLTWNCPRCKAYMGWVEE